MKRLNGGTAIGDDRRNLPIAQRLEHGDRSRAAAFDAWNMNRLAFCRTNNPHPQPAASVGGHRLSAAFVGRRSHAISPHRSVKRSAET
jgi:hypothetical protein